MKWTVLIGFGLALGCSPAVHSSTQNEGVTEERDSSPSCIDPMMMRSDFSKLSVVEAQQKFSERRSDQGSDHRVVLSQEQVCNPDIQATLTAGAKLGLTVHPDGFDDASLGPCLQALSENLCSLILMGTPMSDAGMSHLSSLTNLTELNLANTNVGDAGLSHLSGLTRLTKLILRQTTVSDGGMSHLSGLSNLRVLYVMETQVSERGVAQVQAALPNCKIEHY